MNKFPTACRVCKHFINASTSNSKPVWHSMYCGASPRPLEFDPYTGKKEVPNPEFKFCREVNFGDCPKFQCRHLPTDRDYICANCGEKVNKE